MAATKQSVNESGVRESITRMGSAEWVTFQDESNDQAWIMARVGSDAHAPFTDPTEGHVIRYDRKDAEVYR